MQLIVIHNSIKQKKFFGGTFMLVKVTDSEGLKSIGVPFSKRTLHIYHSIGKYPEIFVKIGRILCIDSDAWEKVVDKAKQETAKRVEKINRLKAEA
jgi:hypothetical protein